MGFDAGKSVNPLEFDFTTLKPCPGELRNAKGRIPEPSADTLNQFSDAFFSMMGLMSDLVRSEVSKADGEEGPDDEGQTLTLLQRLEQWSSRERRDVAEREAMEAAIVDLLMIVCEPVLTKEQLHAMPSRIRTAFTSWLYTELVDPKDALSGMTTSLGVDNDD